MLSWLTVLEPGPHRPPLLREEAGDKFGPQVAKHPCRSDLPFVLSSLVLVAVGKMKVRPAANRQLTYEILSGREHRHEHRISEAGNPVNVTTLGVYVRVRIQPE